jgi:hypothetical protein
MKSIILLGQKIKIIEINDGNVTDYGWYWEDEITINLYYCNTKKIYNQTLIHECFHAILNISAFNEMLDKKTEEVLCRLTENLSLVLK